MHDLHHKYRFLNLKREERSITQRKTRAHHLHSHRGKIRDLEGHLHQHAYNRPAINTNKMKFYIHGSTSASPYNGSGHDHQLTDRDTPCSSKHIEAPCSLQHVDYSTICSSHAPPKTECSYYLQSYVLPRSCAHQGHVSIQAPCLHQSYVLLRPCAH